MNKIALTLLLLVCGCMPGLCQKILVNGSVIDGNSLETLRDVHVYVELTSGTYTDIDGNFRLYVMAGDTISFSLLGYEVVEVGINDSTETQNMIISLKTSTIILNDVQINSMYQANTMIRNPRLSQMQVNGVYAKPKTEADDYNLGVGGAIFSPATAIYRMASKTYKQEKRLYNENQGRAEDAQTYAIAKAKMDEVLEMMGQRLDEYYYVDFIKYSGMTIESFARREIYDLLQLMPESLDRYYDYLDEKLKKLQAEQSNEE
ncbi:carboxypeptidase-like regulatory domain-containing protein [Reichenbachiella agarivorans]|uniref:Carboxypeptidase-like regulatory domain-containing protein n=1 Tax=Reichenbachiella agarivorans TaxID=2979464 RepID=A0ABY6CS59_9BACT|nr:carboxypeptidase-like regulatory domain-containing protein [Reichenbachiella agarivorans]UXP33331.1 carboxypeptidase-like regulatory domain-containing protein [Reichenbachiella agarivorans]